MGAWKDWQIGMIEDGRSSRQIAAAERSIKGTLADPLVMRHAHEDSIEGYRIVTNLGPIVVHGAQRWELACTLADATRGRLESIYREES